MVELYEGVDLGANCNQRYMKLMMTIPDLLRQLHGAGLSSHGKRNVFWGQNHILHNGLQQQVVTMMVMIMMML